MGKFSALPSSKIANASPRGRIPADRVAQHEEAFLDSAASLFRQCGYARVTIDMIARAAHVSTKTIYARYGGKIGIFGAVIRRRVAPILATQDILSGKLTGDPICILRKVAAEFLERLLDKNVLYLHRAMIAEAASMPELSELYYREGYHKALGRLTEWFAAQDALGHLRIPDPERASEVFVALMSAGVLERALLLNVIPEAEEREKLIDSALDVFNRAYGLGCFKS